MTHPADIRVQLATDHAKALAELAAIGKEGDARRALARLARVRRAWMIHALAEESVVYRALEADAVSPGTGSRADERFVEHELVEGLFDQLSRARPGSVEWHARLHVVRDLVARHVDSEDDEMPALLAQRYDGEALVEMGRNFVLARDKLTMLEEAKKAA